MQQPVLVYLPAPATDYLTLEELTVWLGLKDSRTTRKHILLGHIPEGKTRAGGKRLYWTQLEAAIARWNLDNLERYNVQPQPRKRAPKSALPPPNGP